MVRRRGQQNILGEREEYRDQNWFGKTGLGTQMDKRQRGGRHPDKTRGGGVSPMRGDTRTGEGCIKTRACRRVRETEGKETGNESKDALKSAQRDIAKQRWQDHKGCA